MKGPIDDLLSEDCVDEELDVIEKIGFVEDIDLITLKERLRRHGVER